MPDDSGNAAVIAGLIGQNGSEAVSMYAAHASAPQIAIWLQPSATRGLDTVRPIAAPRLLPMPRPNRNTARISEKV